MESTMKGKRAAKSTGKSTPVGKKNTKILTQITLDDIRKVGGNEDDLELIGDLSGSDNDDEDVSRSKEDETDIDPQELKDYIFNLGFNSSTAGNPVDFPEKTSQLSKEVENEERVTAKERKAKKTQKSEVKTPSKTKTQTSEGQPKGDTASSKTSISQTYKQGRPSDVKKSPQGKIMLKPDHVVQHAEVSSTSHGQPTHWTTRKQTSVPKLLLEYTARKQLLFEPEGLCFYRQFQSDPKKFELANDATVASYKELARRVYLDEVQIYTSKKKTDVSSRAKWMQTVVSSGVLADKIAALSLQVQTAPVHTPVAVDTLMNMFRKKGRRETLVAMDALKQLLLQEMLPEKRKLRAFAQHPFHLLTNPNKGQQDDRNRRLLLWYYEDQLKHKYQEFVTELQRLSHDTIPAVKLKSMTTSHELLTQKPEQEKALLTLLVNKIGDPDYKIAARAVHLLQRLVEVHTNMKGVVVTEVEALLYRANVSSKAQYYAICLLNQFILSHDEPDLATKLIVVYFSFFKACMKKQHTEQKMLGAVLTGVNRAYPYSDVSDDRVSEQTDALFRVVHITPFNTSIQALLLLKQVMDSRQSISDRFYSALYSKLLDRSVEHSPRQAMFLNLLYQSLKADTVIGRIKAFTKRLLQICATQQPPFICGALFLVSETINLRPALRNVVMEAIDSDDEEHFVDVDDDKDVRRRLKAAKGSRVSSEGTSSWVHQKIKNPDKKTAYDPTVRNPQYCGAEGSIFWELTKLEAHYHPSVALFARTIRDGLKVHYMGNPLQDFTQMRFLDRFVYKNPKKHTERAKVSVMEPKVKSYRPPAIRQMAVNTKDYLKTSQDKIPIDEVFFHKYFTSKRRKIQLASEMGQDDKAKPAGEDSDEFEFDSDASSVDDDEFDRILDTMDLEEEEEDDDDEIDFAGEVTRKKKAKKLKKGKASRDESSDDDDLDDDDDDDLDDLDDMDALDESDLQDDSDIGDNDFSSDEDQHDDGFTVEHDEFDEEAFGESDDERTEAPTKPKPAKPKSKKHTKPTAMDDDSDGKFDFIGAVGAGKRKARKETRKGVKKRRKVEDDGGNLHAAAEEFSSLMDEHVGAKFDSIGINALANKDKADAKQLNWEIRRDKWIQGRDPKSMIMAKKRGKRGSFKKKGVHAGKGKGAGKRR